MKFDKSTEKLVYIRKYKRHIPATIITIEEGRVYKSNYVNGMYYVHAKGNQISGLIFKDLEGSTELADYHLEIVDSTFLLNSIKDIHPKDLSIIESFQSNTVDNDIYGGEIDIMEFPPENKHMSILDRLDMSQRLVEEMDTNDDFRIDFNNSSIQSEYPIISEFLDEVFLYMESKGYLARTDEGKSLHTFDSLMQTFRNAYWDYMDNDKKVTRQELVKTFARIIIAIENIFENKEL